MKSQVIQMILMWVTRADFLKFIYIESYKKLDNTSLVLSS